MIVVIATMHAQEGKEDKLKDILTAVVVETRQEQGNLKCDLLVGDEDPKRFVLLENWQTDSALNAHLRSRHINVAYSFADEIVEEVPEVVAYHVVEPNRTHHTGPTRRLTPEDTAS